MSDIREPNGIPESSETGGAGPIGSAPPLSPAEAAIVASVSITRTHLFLHTTKARIIEYFLDTFKRYMDEALRER